MIIVILKFKYSILHVLTMKNDEFLKLLEDYLSLFDIEREYCVFFCNLCNVEVEDLNQRVLEHYLDRIVGKIEEMKSNKQTLTEYGDLYLYFILAILIFKTGSAFPDKVKKILLEKNKHDWVEELGGIKDFRQKISRHIPGRSLPLYL